MVVVKKTGSATAAPGTAENIEAAGATGADGSFVKRVRASRSAMDVNVIKRSKVRVVVRVRPGLERDIDNDPKHVACLSCEPRIGNRIAVKNVMEKTFSAVLGPQCSQRDLYMECGKPMLEAIFSGQTACMFAYGQTGSGK